TGGPAAARFRKEDAMPAAKAVPAAAYYRMSKDEQEDSVERQRSQVLPYAARQGYEVVGEYEDLGIRGHEFERRPGLQRLLAAALAGRFRVILCDEPERLSRQEPIEFIEKVVAPLRRAGIVVDTVAKGRQDWDTVVGVIMLAITQDKAASES